LKRQKPLSYFERQRLEGLLKDSQVLAKGIEELEERIARWEKNLRRERQRVVDVYRRDLERLLSALEKAGGTAEEASLVKQLQQLRQKKAAVEEELRGHRLSARPFPPVTWQADDSPRQIQEKADLLKDQEDKARRYTQSLEVRLRELREELRLRQRMREFVEDLRLLSQQDEPRARGGRTMTSAAETDATQWTGPGREMTDKAEAIQNPAAPTLEISSELAPSRLPTQDLERLIRSLEKERRTWTATADSLGQRAKEFYQKAEEGKVNRSEGIR